MSSRSTRKFWLPLISLVLLAAASSAWAVNVVTVTATGKDLSEAMAAAVRAAVAGNLPKERNQLRSMTESELVPFASQLVNSYKIASESGGAVTINADIDLDELRALVALSPKAVGSSEKDAKGLVLLRAPQVNAREGDWGYAKGIEQVMRDRLQRRRFKPIKPDAEGSEQFSADTSVLQPELLRAEAQRTGAGVVLSLLITSGSQENENSHRSEERLFLQAQLFDANKGQVLAKAKTSIPQLLAKKEELERLLREKGDELLQDIFIQAGSRFVGATESAKGGLVLRVLDPPSFRAVNALRLALEEQKDIRGITERRILRGSYEFQVRTSMNASALAAKVRSLTLDGFEISLEQDKLEEVQVRMKAVAAVPAEDAGGKP